MSWLNTKIFGTILATESSWAPLATIVERIIDFHEKPNDCLLLVVSAYVGEKKYTSYYISELYLLST